MQPDFLYIIDILGTFAFAVSGAFLAMEKQLDPFGVLVIAFVTSIGGGTLRDILIGNLPVTWLHNETAMLVIFSSAIAAMLFGRHLKKMHSTLLAFDALGLGLFTMVGIALGMQNDFSWIVCIALGTISACFGGVIRDVLLNEVPFLFRKEIYALACISGGAIYFLLLHLGVDRALAHIFSILFIFTLRMLAIRYNISLPRFYLKYK